MKEFTPIELVESVAWLDARPEPSIIDQALMEIRDMMAIAGARGFKCQKETIQVLEWLARAQYQPTEMMAIELSEVFHECSEDGACSFNVETGAGRFSGGGCGDHCDEGIGEVNREKSDTQD
jgi:hypothetical protein